MARDIVLRATFQELVGDETYELWLKHDDEWALNQAGDVVLSSGHQDFTLLALVTGDDYAAQIRLKRAGRYRVGYLSGNPDTWPAQSRCDFVPGALAGVGAPTIDSAVWSRTDADHQKIRLTITPDTTEVNVAIFRDGVEIAVVEMPLLSPFTYDDIDPPIATSFSYTAKHKTAGGLYGPESGAASAFSGPGPVTGFDVTSAINDYGKYSIAWDDDGRHYRVQDDYLCTLSDWVDIVGSPFFGVGFVNNINKESTEIPEGSTQNIVFHVRIRAEVTTFGVTDVSDWNQLLVEMSIDDPDDDTGYNSCP